ncbi:DNA gyrase subunit B [Fusobacterium polymorphum]|uniref:DNA gyrase subunit B n=2 Tax=Fusobacterium nucleatum subsp. polymorphum TaxID=76857 RepID=A5TSE1_FUSNP|nr:DNA topoisomerase (ATP-hydrolyzing) subunit B [Fusobacterium polymorphum]BEO92915.1 DNA topoisomerase (ATP-hydrolyzing) subunit B [Fusobacterium nucleatum]EDK87816.1 DNA topoisomerase (ATP-hydrolyzing) [Fusobacterium polymorphum ATCC 10953]UTI53076.1 DNA topoisomerase (ATP-hydrolyzing) subunit B [Fusobacterium polymorphum]WRL67591.1 DNA topoisomerase (ATP-hydrolyzing) subunit B [Fusobacterium polymorphum]WRL69714.1 DNA topoisomerase (ATP-hydrolyzing) subunit B [Fusobacterium polymorphum]
MSYEAQNITVLEGLEAVRKRPGMYIGTTSERGLHHLVWEIVDNSVDEALAGYCDKIEVKILPDNIIEVVDNGRGIPTDIHPKYGKSALEIVLTVLHAGGKFENDNYKVSGGLHGVGVSVVNALSEWLEVEVRKAGVIHYQKYHRGKPEEDVKIIGSCDENEHGTIVRFKADGEIFETLIYNYFTLSNRLKELAYLNKGLTITLSDLRKDEKKEETYKFDGGILDFLNEIVKEDTTIIEKPFYISSEQDNVGVDVTFTYTTSQNEVIYSFVNNINTHEGGTHVQGFRTALTKVINDVGKAQGLLKDKDGKLMGNDIREGVVGIVSTKIPQPQFEGQTKGKLGNSEVSGIVNTIVSNSLKIFLEDNPNITKIIIEKILNSKKAREAAQKARELVLRKSVLEVGSLPGKLADCTSKKAEECEIFIVEGDSAGGSAKQGRDRYNQAILPLRGKIINVEKAGLHKSLESSEIRAMVTAFGTSIGETFDISKLRYGKIILMTDADVDGAHIRTLILTFLYRYMIDLIYAGNVYIACPPLYKVSSGKQIVYAYNDLELKNVLGQMNQDNKKYTIQRYKGLGEMNPEQLWETTMNPDGRLLLKVSIDNAREADMLFDKLMGDKVEPRREFIEEHAEYVKNIDI